jgi:hypothetical protein
MIPSQIEQCLTATSLRASTLYNLPFPSVITMADNGNMAGDDLSQSSDHTTPLSEKEIRSAIPNGGFIAWLQVLGSFLLFLNSW